MGLPGQQDYAEICDSQPAFRVAEIGYEIASNSVVNVCAPNDEVFVNVGPWRLVDHQGVGCYYDFDNLVLYADPA